jgi:hypothetical protein
MEEGGDIAQYGQQMEESDSRISHFGRSSALMNDKNDVSVECELTGRVQSIVKPQQQNIHTGPAKTLSK